MSGKRSVQLEANQSQSSAALGGPALPRSPRETLELFASLGTDADLDSLLRQINWAGVTPVQIYQIILGRVPESASLAVANKGYSARDHALHALTCSEYQTKIRERVLTAYPEKRRLVFIHVPKCAGTDLVEILGGLYPRVFEDLSKPEWISGPAFFSYLAELVRRLRDADSIFVHGHVPLLWYLDRGLARFGDQLFTVVRKPLEIMLSHANYVLKRFFEEPRLPSLDTRAWGDILGIQFFDRQTPRAELVKLGLKILREPRIVPPNCICAYLGDGTADVALDAIGRCDLEITDTTRYSVWLRERWGGQTINANRSPPILSVEDLDAGDLEYLKSVTRQDDTLYRHIMERLERSGVNSVRGTELA